jgi:hypothetical protein
MGWTEFEYQQYLRAQGQAHADTPERVLLADIRRVARPHGWQLYHTYDSRRSDEGFPDLVLVRESVIFAELKRQSHKPTPAQETWLTMLARAQSHETYLWRPRDLPAILARLERPWRAA